MNFNETITRIAEGAHIYFYEEETFDSIDEAIAAAAQDLINEMTPAAENAWDSDNAEEFYDARDACDIARLVITDHAARTRVFDLMINN